MFRLKISKLAYIISFFAVFIVINITVTNLTAATANFQFSTYFGGSLDDSEENTNDLGKMSIELDKDGNVIIVGRTFSSDYPTTIPNPGVQVGGTDVVVSKFSHDGSDLLFSTKLSGGSHEWATDVVTDDEGSIYIVGTTSSSNFYQNNSEQPSNNGGSRNNDAFVAKISSTGVIEWCRFFGGSQDDWGYAIDVDSEKNVFITGSTYSGDFLQLKPGSSYSGGGVDFYLAKFNSTGGLQFVTMLGTLSNDWGIDLELDSEENVVIVGGTMSLSFPTYNAYKSENGGTMDCIVLKYDNDGTLLFSGLVGYTGQDRAYGMTLDSNDDIYFTGSTFLSFANSKLVTSDYSGGSEDVFVAKMSSDGQSLKYLTLIGGSAIDTGFDVVVDSEKNAYIVGESYSSDFPDRESFDEDPENREGFMTILNARGYLLTSSLFGGDVGDSGQDVCLSFTNEVYLTGYTTSSNFPIKNPHNNNSTLNGGSDIFLMGLTLDLPTLPKYPTSVILWISISGGVGLVAIASIVTIVLVKKRQKK